MNENPVPVFVRARDGALYKNPLLVLAEGWVHFVGCNTRLGELVEWITDPAAPAQYPEALAARLVGRCAFLRGHRTAERVVPFSKPAEFRAARIFTVQLLERIPRPTSNEGVERYASRCPAGAQVYEFPHEPGDAKRIQLK